MSTKQAILQLKLIDGVTGPAAKIAAVLGTLNRAVTGFNAQRLAANAAFMDAGVQALAFGAALAVPVRSAIKLEDSLSDFNRVANLSDQQLAATKNTLLGLAREIPVARDELVQVAEAVVSAGAPMGELEERIRLITMASTAWGSQNQQTANDLSAMGSSLGLTLPQLHEMADVINHLANNYAAEAPAIVDFMKRIGALGKLAGLSKEQTAGLGTELLGMGVNSDVAATAVQAVLRSLTRGKAATEGQQKAFKALGLDATKVAKAMQADGKGTIVDVLERLAKLSADERLSVANQLFGDEGRAFLSLIEHRDRLNKTMDEASDQTKTAGSVEKEYAAAIKKTSSQLRILRNRLDNVSEAFGSALLPSVKDGSTALGGFLDKVDAVVRANPDMTRNLTLTAAGLVATRVAATGARAALFAMLRPTNLLIAGLAYVGYQNFDVLKGALTDLGTLAADLSKTDFVKGFLAGAGEAMKAIGDGAQRTIAAMRELAGEGTKLREWLDSAAGEGWGKTLGAVAVGLGAIGATAAALAAVAGPLRAIGRAALWLTGIKPAMGLLAMIRGLGRSNTGLAETAGALERLNAAAIKAGKLHKPSMWSMLLGGGLLAEAGAAIPTDQKEFDAFRKRNMERSDALNRWLEQNIGTPSSWLGLQTPAADPRQKANADGLRKQLDNETADWPARAQRSIKSYGLALAQGGAQAEAEAAAIGARIETELAVTGRPEVDTANLERALNLARQVAAAVRGMNSAPSTTPANTNTFGGPRARGGPVKAGVSYLTGEIGPELFVPNRNGTIVPNKDLAQAAPSVQAPGAGGMTVHMPLQIHLSGKATREDGLMLWKVLSEKLSRSQQTSFGGLKFAGDT